MMDGRVGAIRAALDAEGFHHVSIMSYTAKYVDHFIYLCHHNVWYFSSCCGEWVFLFKLIHKH